MKALVRFLCLSLLLAACSGSQDSGGNNGEFKPVSTDLTNVAMRDVEKVELTILKDLPVPSDQGSLLMLDGQPWIDPHDLSQVKEGSNFCNFYLADGATLKAREKTVFVHNEGDQEFHSMKPLRDSVSFTRLACVADMFSRLQEEDSANEGHPSSSTDYFGEMTLGQFKAALGDAFAVRVSLRKR